MSIDMNSRYGKFLDTINVNFVHVGIPFWITGIDGTFVAKKDGLYEIRDAKNVPADSSVYEKLLLNDNHKAVATFNVGDRVVFEFSGKSKWTTNPDSLSGKMGIVKVIDSFSCGVEFDEKLDGAPCHCDLHCKPGYSAWCSCADLKLLEEVAR